MPALAYALLRKLHDNHVMAPLTRRQGQVWACLAIGLTDGETAHDLGIRAPTVRGHVSNLQRALFDPLEVPASRTILAVYFWLHHSCCRTEYFLETIKTA